MKEERERKRGRGGRLGFGGEELVMILLELF